MGFLSSSINSWISQKQTNKTIKNIHMNNLNNKNVAEYLPSEIEGFFDPYEPVGSTVISGGQAENRAKAVAAACICALNNNIPAIVLHESNDCLENKIWSTFQASGGITIINKNNPIYDPISGLTNSEIGQLVINSAPKGNDIKPGARQYMDGIAEFVRSQNVSPYCDIFIRCPHDTLFDRLDAVNKKGKLSDTDAQKIRNLLMQGQSERASLESFFTRLGYQGKYLLANKTAVQRSENIRKTVEHNSLIMIDIQSSTNNILLNIIVNEIQDALASGKKLLLVIDTISTDSNELLGQLIKSHSSRCISVISSDDVYAMLGSNDNLFSTMVGTAQKCIVYSHRTGISCGKWSDVFGYYDVDKISQNIGSNQNYQSGYSYGSSNSINVNNIKEHRIKPQEIGSMTPNEVFILNGATGELAHTTLL